jgi:hypothetical protein
MYQKQKDMTASQLIANAENLGAKISLEYPDSIGIQFKSNRYSGLWHWFSVDKIGEKVYIDFSHSYSQNTGASKKGLYHSMSIKSKLGFYES